MPSLIRRAVVVSSLEELRLAWQASGLHLSDEFLRALLRYIRKLEKQEKGEKP
jgi:hypothetical protein